MSKASEYAKVADNIPYFNPSRTPSELRVSFTVGGKGSLKICTDTPKYIVAEDVPALIKWLKETFE
mgnify:CR=1 FL=1